MVLMSQKCRINKINIIKKNHYIIRIFPFEKYFGQVIQPGTPGQQTPGSGKKKSISIFLDL